MVQPEDIRVKQFSSNDRFLLDTNIWLFLQGPPGNPSDPRPNIYSKALSDMLTAKCTLIVDALVISEFINRYSRIHYDLVKQVGETFKQYRQSAAYKLVASTIAGEVRDIFSICGRVECGFSVLDDADLLDTFSKGDSDFNDLIIAEVCRTNNCALVTHDADFKGANVPILTANKKLLNS